jgi:uncharacterized repeat protein (TIGR01451 family)
MYYSLWNLSEFKHQLSIVTTTPAPSAPTISASKTDICGTEKAILTATGCTGGTITWSGGGTGTTREVGAGTYTATCTTTCGTSGNSNSVTISTTPAPTAPSITANKTQICGTEKAILTATGCAGGTITWSGGGTGTTREVGAGTYTATCTTTCGTSGNSNSVTITTGSVPTPPIISSTKTEICGTESITLTATGCVGSLKWSNGQTSSSISVSSAGDYAAICVNNCGDSDNSNIIKIIKTTVPNAPLVTTDKSSVCGTEKARLVVVGCAGTVEWSTGEKGEMINVGVGTYTAKCFNSCGSSPSSNIVKIESGVLPTAPSITANKTEICGTEKATLTATGCTSGTITWSGGGTGTTREVGAGTYTATCTTSCGVSGTSNSVTITTTAAPTAPSITSNKTEICGTEKATLTATGCTGGTITWSGGGTGTTKEVAAGTYTATCTTSCGVSGNSNSVTISATPVPTAPSITANKTEICGTEKATLTATGCVGGTITWSVGGTGTTREVGAGTYTATCTTTCGTSVNSNSVTIISAPAPAAPTITANKTQICGTEKVTLTATGCTGGTITWSGGGTGTTREVGAGTYTATCATTCGTSGTSNSITIVVESTPASPSIASNKTQVCGTEKAILTATGCTGGTIIWSGGGTGTTREVGAGTYTATCTTTCGTSVNSNSVTISTGTTPSAPTIAANKTEICGTDKSVLTATGCTGGTVTWSGGGTGTTKEVGAGTYTATCTNTCGTSSSSNTITVILGVTPTAPVITASKTEICGTETVTLSVTGCSGTIRWSNNKTTSSITISEAGEYAAVCVSNCGESPNSNVIKINKASTPSAPLITTDRVNVCGEEKARLVAVGCTGTIEWSTNQSGDMIQVGAGTYTAKCKNACGISVNSNVIKIESGGKPDAPTIIANKTSICGIDSVKLTGDVCSGTIKWSNGREGAMIFVKVVGTYTATCTNSCGVSLASNQIVIVSGGVPSAPKIEANTTKICQGDSAILTSDGCSGTITWSNGSVGSRLVAKTAGTYSAKCKNACGESANSNSISIELKTTGCTPGCTLPAPSISASKTELCEPSDVTLTATNCSTGTVVWSNGKTGLSIVVKPVVTTSYTAICKKDTCVSVVSNKINVVVEKANKPVVACATDLICLGESVTLNAYECAGEIRWSNGMKGKSIIVTPIETSKYTAVCAIGTCVSEKSDTLCIIIGNPNKPFITCRANTICLGEAAVLTAQGCSGDVIWSNGQKGSVLTVTPTVAGVFNYTAVCKSKSGKCESAVSNSISITVGGAVSVPKAIAEIKNICPFETVDLNSAILGSPSTAGGSFEFHISNSINSALITTPGMVGAGSYYLFERSKVGCYSNPTLINVKIESCGSTGIKPDSTKFVDISLTKTANSINVPVNQFVIYKVVVRNRENFTATNVVIRDVMPAGLVLDSVSTNAKKENGNVMVNIPSLAKADSVVFTYKAKVTGAGKIVNKVEMIKVDQIDNVISNNTSTFTINDLSKSDLLGLSKVAGEITKISENRYEVPFTMYLSNMGSNRLTNVQLIDNLDQTFGSGVVILDDKITVKADSGLVVNANYTGRGVNTKLLVDSLSSIGIGKKLSVSFKVKVDISAASTKRFFNSADASAGRNGTIKDRSTNGLNADPDGDGNPTNNEEPTPVQFVSDSNKVAIATALSIYDSSFVDNKTYQVKYRALIKNVGIGVLKNVGLTDSLNRVFPDSIQFEVVGVPVVSRSSTLKANPAFNGNTDPRVLLADSTTKLNPNQTDTVVFTVRLKFMKNYGPYFNNTIASGTGVGGEKVFDISNTGTVIVASSSSPTVFTIPKDVKPGESLVDKVVIPDGFSPNGDGDNDNLESLVPEGVEVEIFELYNRWGHLVWKYKADGSAKGEKIVWDASSNTGLRFGPDGVPDGTYYYSIKAKGEAKVRAGFITVVR